MLGGCVFGIVRVLEVIYYYVVVIEFVNCESIVIFLDNGIFFFLFKCVLISMFNFKVCFIY